MAFLFKPHYYLILILSLIMCFAFSRYTDNLCLVVSTSSYRTTVCLTALLTRKLDWMLNIEIGTK
jgi:hypothetical protein